MRERGTLLRADASVIVLDVDDGRRHPLTPQGRHEKRIVRIRLAPLLGIVIAHAAILALAISAPSEITRAPETEELVSVLVRPRVVVSDHPIAAPPAVRIPKDVPLVYDVPIPDLAQPTIAVLGVGTMPPSVSEPPLDTVSFAHRAGLRPGEGATVVLRLQVLSTGELGRIEIEVSGGGADIDREAIAFVKSMHWTSGMVDGHEQTMWIRWGVRLQA